MPDPTKPLDRFPIVRTRDPDEMDSQLTRIFGDHHFAVRDARAGFSAWGNHVKLGGAGISYGGYGAPVTISYPNAPIGYTVLFAAAGAADVTTGGRAVHVDGEHAVVLTPGRPVCILHGADNETLCAQLDADALTRKLAALIGFAPQTPVVVEPELDLRQPSAAFCMRLLNFVVAEADSQASDFGKTALVEMEQTLMIAMLRSTQHNFSRLLQGSAPRAAPWQVRRVEEYIESHWDQPITVEALAEAANSSARSIFHSFRQFRGYSPMAYTKVVRLRHAKEMLSATGRRVSVTDVAYCCGFSNLGNFAREYCRCHGELPSDTLKSARAALIS